jgi:hypothetical protein
VSKAHARSNQRLRAKDKPEPARDRPFNAWRIPKAENAKAMVQDVIGQVQVYEQYYGVRKRRRKNTDQQAFEATVSALICDIVHNYLTGRDGGVFVTRSNQVLGQRSRYRPLAYGKCLPTIIDRLAKPEMAFLKQEVGSKNPFAGDRRTVIHCGKRLISRIVDHGLGLDDLGRSKGEEVIILKRVKDEADYWDDGGFEEYEDTPVTYEYRAEVETINHWLMEADIAFDEAVLKRHKIVDTNERRLRRIFTRGRFDSGGRLFGGFWQDLTKKERHERLIIDGEQAVELDYGQMTPRILYGLARSIPLAHDLYVIPGFEFHRRGVKKVMNAMMFASKRLFRMPQGVRLEFSLEHRMDEVMRGIEAAHPALKDYFFTGIGHHAQFLESQIIVDVLLALRQSNIVGLPIHDAVMVPASKTGEVRDIMLSIFHYHTGIDGLVGGEN